MDDIVRVWHRGVVWTAAATGDEGRPYRLRSGLVEITLVRLNRGRPEELVPVDGTRQLTARYGLFTDEGGELHGLEP